MDAPTYEDAIELGAIQNGNYKKSIQDEESEYYPSVGLKRTGNKLISENEPNAECTLRAYIIVLAVKLPQALQHSQLTLGLDPGYEHAKKLGIVNTIY